MLISAVIPTRNRAEDLERAVLSVCAQTRLPDELIVIDQSADTAPRERALAALNSSSSTLKVDYVLDPQIAGLVAARDAAVARAHGDIVCFLEDDVVLEPDYLRNIEAAFQADPEMVGCCGIVSNLPPLAPFYFSLFHFFHRGIFHDTRVGVTGVMTGSGHALIPSDYLSGGLSAYRRIVFEKVPFDLRNNLFALEDVDFSTRVTRVFGPRLYINPNARLEHRMSPANRAVLGPRHERKVREFVIFYKKRRAEARARDLALILAGLFLEAIFQALRQRSIDPILGYFRGVWSGARWKVVGV